MCIRDRNKSKADLITQASTTLADNTTQAISPQDVRVMAENLAESNFNKTTDNALVGLKAYDTGVIYKVSQGVNYNGSLYFANKDTTPGAFNTADWDLFAEQSNVVISGKKASAGTIAKGKPVYLVGFDSDLHTVEEANAGAVGTMPVIGFAAENMDATNAKKITTFGKLTGLDTSAFSLGADLYISTTTGTLTATRPTGAGSFIQRVAKVLKSAASGGQLFIFNTARAAGLPNLAQDNVWLGDANGQPQAVNKSTITPTDAQIEIGYNNQVPEVTQSEAEAGTVTTVKRWTPQRVKQAIDALASGGDSIYTADGTVSANRSINFSNNFLTFDNLQVFDLDAGSTSAFVMRINAGSNSISNASKIELYETSSYTGYAKSLIFRARKNEGSIKHLAYTNSTHCFYLTNAYSATTDFTNINRRFEIGNNLTFFQNTDLVIAPNVTTGTPALIGTEQISLQGHTIVKGGGTGTGTTLALYDNDSTPRKTWEFLDNGNVNIGQDSTVNLDTKILTFDAGTTTSSVNVGLVIDTRNIFSTASAAPSVFKILGLSGNPVFTVHSRGYPVSKSDYTGVIAQFENRAGTQGLNLSSGTSQIASNGFRHIATNSDISDRIDQNVTNVYQQWVMVKNNVKNHWLRNGDTLAQASFFIDGFSGKGFNVGAGAPIGTENISLQGHTIIKGAGTTTGTTLALYDNQGTPAKTWEWLDNGNVNLGAQVVFESTFQDMVKFQSNALNPSLIINALNTSSNSNMEFEKGGVKKWLFGNTGSNDSFRIYNYTASSNSIEITANNKINLLSPTLTSGNFNIGEATSIDTTNSTPLYIKCKGGGNMQVEIDSFSDSHNSQVKYSQGGSNKWLAGVDSLQSFRFYNFGNSSTRFEIKSNTTNISMPTSPTGLSSGDLWNDNGTVKIV